VTVERVFLAVLDAHYVADISMPVVKSGNLKDVGNDDQPGGPEDQRAQSGRM